MSLRIIFAGTPQFAVPTLQALINSKHQVIAVYTQPDRPAGRGQKLLASPVKQLAQEKNINVYQPLSLRDQAAQNELKQLNADLMVVVAYGLILPKAVLEIPRLGCINVHASLLPRWRGAAPIQRSILAGDTETGITIMQMDEGLDTGDMLKKVSCPINNGNSAELHQHLATLGAEALISVLTEIENNSIQRIPQNHQDATYAAKITKTEAQINWLDSAEQIARQIRAFNPWPIAYTEYEKIILRIWDVEVIYKDSHLAPGTIVNITKSGIDVVTGNGILRMTKIQLPNGRPLTITEFLNGHAQMFVMGVSKLGSYKFL